MEGWKGFELSKPQILNSKCITQVYVEVKKYHDENRPKYY